MPYIFNSTSVFTDNERIQPHYQQAWHGDSVKFTCLSKTPVSWYHNEMFPIASHMRILDMSLFIESVGERDWGTYTCQGQVKAGLEFFALAYLEVKSTIKLL